MQYLFSYAQDTVFYFYTYFILIPGYSKFRIPAIEPFDLPALDIAKGQGAVSIDLSLQKIKVHGLSSAVINSLQ